MREVIVVSKAQKQALKKYAQSKKGQAALQRAHQKRTKTEEYRAYQRQKQAEYRRKAKEGQNPKTTQAQPNQLPAASIPELDQLIERFEADLDNCIQQQELSPQSLPLAYRTLVDALSRWQVRQIDASTTSQS